MGGALLLAICTLSIAAPLLGTVDPVSINPAYRLRDPSAAAWFGTDRFGRGMRDRARRRAGVARWQAGLDRVVHGHPGPNGEG